jgi:hypothetical protein
VRSNDRAASFFAAIGKWEGVPLRSKGLHGEAEADDHVNCILRKLANFSRRRSPADSPGFFDNWKLTTDG